MAGLSRAYKRRGNMVANTGGPVMCLDAGSRLSYPGTGTTWTDLSGNGNNGTLINGPTYSSANAGSIVFDGVNDYVVGASNTGISGNAAVTISQWMNIADATTGGCVVAIGQSAGGMGAIGVFVNIRGGLKISAEYAGNNPATASTTISVGSWNHVAVTKTPGAVNTTTKIYVNGVESLIDGSASGATPNIVNSALYIGQFITNDYFYGGSIGHATLYNRALSAAEVATNFNLTRGRYGI